MKLRADRKSALNNRNADVELPIEDHQDDQWLKDNIHTMEVDFDFFNTKKENGNLIFLFCFVFLYRKCIN